MQENWDIHPIEVDERICKGEILLMIRSIEIIREPQMEEGYIPKYAIHVRLHAQMYRSEY